MKPVPFTRFTTLRDQLTAGQRAFARVAYDGLDPGELEGEERARARDVWGDLERIPAAARAVVAQVKGRDVAGTRLGAERCLHLAVTLPLDRIGREELAFVVFGGPKMRHARVALRFALGAARKNGVRVEDDTRDGFTVLRHDGRRVRFECFAASRGGDTARGVPIVAALLDEAAFYFDDASGVVNAEAIFAAIVPRLLPGGQILLVSSPWSESGLLFSEFEKNHGNPRTAIAAHCPTLVMRDDPETIAMVARERERDPENARREFDAEFMSAGAGLFFPTGAIRAAFMPELAPLTKAEPGARVGVGADIGLVKDSSAIVAVHVTNGIFRVAEALELRPTKGASLLLSRVVRDFCGFASRHGVRRIVADHHVLHPAREHLVDGVGLEPIQAGQEAKVETYVEARKLLTEGRLVCPGVYRTLAEQLAHVVAKPTAGGGTVISSPRRGGAHGDVVSALILAVHAARTAWVGGTGGARVQSPRRYANDLGGF